MTGKESFFKLIEEGRKGHNIGLSIGSEKLKQFTDGLLGGTSYLIGGASGSSKSTFFLHSLLYCPLIEFLNNPEHKEKDPYWILWNLEMTKEQIYAKLVSMYIFDQRQKQLRFKEIFSRGKDCILSDEKFNWIKECSDFIDILDQRLICIDGGLNEAKYVKNVEQILAKFGTWNEDGSFTPNNPHQIIVGAIDHCSLVKASNGRSKKDEMDAISRDSVLFRNKTKIFSPAHISQFNRSGRSDERLKQDMQDPTESDFKDSGALYEDSQVVFAVHSPHKFKKTSYHKYNIKELEQNFIAIFCLKSRFGTSDFFVPLGFYGDCSHYYELPKPDEIYDYEKYKTPYWVFEKDIKQDNIINKQDDKEEKIDEQSNFNFII